MMHSGVSNMRQQMMAFRSRGMRNEDKDAFQISWTEYFLLGTVELEPARTAHLSSDTFWANNIVPGSNLRMIFSNLCRMHCGLLHKNAERIYAECIGLPAASHERRANHFSALGLAERVSLTSSDASWVQRHWVRDWQEVSHAQNPCCAETQLKLRIPSQPGEPSLLVREGSGKETPLVGGPW